MRLLMKSPDLCMYYDAGRLMVKMSINLPTASIRCFDLLRLNDLSGEDGSVQHIYQHRERKADYYLRPDVRVEDD